MITLASRVHRFMFGGVLGVSMAAMGCASIEPSEFEQKEAGLLADGVGAGCGEGDCGSSIEDACDVNQDCGSGEVCCGDPSEVQSCVAEGECFVDVSSTPGDERPGMVQCYTSSLRCDDLCCVNATAPSFECGTTATTCPGSGGGVQATARCDGPEDCPSGRECCQNMYGSRSCSTSCSVMTVCHTDDDCPSGTCDARGECDPVN
jgi:hypothetical protein